MGSWREGSVQASLGASHHKAPASARGYSIKRRIRAVNHFHFVVLEVFFC